MKIYTGNTIMPKLHKQEEICMPCGQYDDTTKL
jgi:hypothetical protein